MADQERIKARLNNIRSVEPIFGAMRTISLGSWQGAINRQQRLADYSRRLGALLPHLIPHLDAERSRLYGRARRGRQEKGGSRLAKLARRRSDPVPVGARVVLVIGSERGLCGAFNISLAQYADKVLLGLQAAGAQVEVALLGSRSRRALERKGWKIDWFKSLPMTTLPTTALAHDVTQVWLERYEAHGISAVDVVHNSYRNSTLYEPRTARLLPPPLPQLALESAPWPPPYIDTDPVALYARLIRLWMTTEMYRILLDSAAAEHSARYQLMEGATQNSQRLIEELTLELQTARQQAVTSEMQELASGAGLLGS